MIVTLLPRAFSKYTKIHAYIDTREGWLFINSISPNKVELVLSMIKKSLGEGFDDYNVHKPSAILTHWLKNNEYPNSFEIEKSCIMQDPNQQNRMIRCQQQD